MIEFIDILTRILMLPCIIIVFRILYEILKDIKKNKQ